MEEELLKTQEDYLEVLIHKKILKDHMEILSLNRLNRNPSLVKNRNLKHLKVFLDLTQHMHLIREDFLALE